MERVTLHRLVSIPEVAQVPFEALTGLPRWPMSRHFACDGGVPPGAVYVISPKTMKVVQKFPIPLANCAGAQGLAIGPDSQILLGCNAPSNGTASGAT